MQYTVDRITEQYVVLQDENGVVGHAEKVLFPYVKEGDVLTVDVDENATSAKKEQIQNKLHSLFQKGQSK